MSRKLFMRDYDEDINVSDKIVYLLNPSGDL